MSFLLYVSQETFNILTTIKVFKPTSPQYSTLKSNCSEIHYPACVCVHAGVYFKFYDSLCKPFSVLQKRKTNEAVPS